MRFALPHRRPPPAPPSEKAQGFHFDTTVIDTEDDHSTANLMPSRVTVADEPPSLKIKRVDHYYSSWGKCWKYRNSGSSAIPEMRPTVSRSNTNDPWQGYCFVVVRKLPQQSDIEIRESTFQIIIKSPYLLTACRDVMQDIPGVSWTAQPLELDPRLFITFLPQLEEYRDKLQSKRGRSTEETHVLSTLKLLLNYLHEDYRATIAQISNLLSHGEITFSLLYAIMIPRTIFVTECPITGEFRCVRLLSSTAYLPMANHTDAGYYDILCESIDIIDDAPPTIPDDSNPTNPNQSHLSPSFQTLPDSSEADARKALGKDNFGRVQHKVFLSPFKGTKKISELDVYPIQYQPQMERFVQHIVARGRKWASMRGVHHMQYKGTAFQLVTDGRSKTQRYNVNSRVMIDRANFRRLNPSYPMPVAKPANTHPAPVADPNPARYRADLYAPSQIPATIPTAPTLRVRSKTQAEAIELTADELLLTPAVIYGFSLSDKVWLELNIELVQQVEWNDEAFANLVLPPGRKALLQSLIEAHNSELGFDDFILGKGHGLVINLFGPPGVGKTLSAEATSEHVRRPLYVIGSGDLGTSASSLDKALSTAFDIATTWKAIVLIDEADVFLEQRSLQDLARNAMVAVFLRHVEYYRGILFLTTNRVKTFDEAFLSRIHIALHFQNLTKDAKLQIWSAFLNKVGVDLQVFGQDRVEKLAEREINGRQIKNATRTAQSLAFSRGEKLDYKHIEETLTAMEEFAAQFRSITEEPSAVSK